MSILRRRLAKMQPPAVPAGYERLPWIVFESKTFIDTGYVNKSLKGVFHIGFEIYNNSLYTRYFISTKDSQGLSLYANTNSSNLNYKLGGDYGDNWRYSDVSLTVPFGKLDVVLSRRRLYVNGVSADIIHNGSVVGGHVLIGYHNSTGQNISFNGKLFYFKIEEDSLVKLWLLPAKRSIDGKKGLVDVVSGNFYTSPNGYDFI